MAPSFAAENKAYFQVVEDIDSPIPVEAYDLKTQKWVEVYKLEKGDVVPGLKFEKDMSLSLGISDKGQLLRISPAGARNIKLFDMNAKKTLYLDGPEGTPFTLTREPGRTWQDCAKQVAIDQSGTNAKAMDQGMEEMMAVMEGKPEGFSGDDFSKVTSQSRGYKDIYCAAWPKARASTQLQMLDSKIMEFDDPVRGKRYEIFYKVDADYDSNLTPGEREHRAGYWIRGDQVRAAALPAVEVPIVEFCPESPAPPPQPPKTPEQGQTLKDIADTKHKEFMAKLEPLMGVCVKDNPGQGKNALQRSVGNYWTKFGPEKMKTLGPQSGPAAITQQDLYAIDALARTMYGEMRGCFKNGLRYPKAVAAVAMNRARYVQRNGNTPPFVRNEDSSFAGADMEDVLPAVLGSPKQFSVWNHNDNNFSVVRCPKRNANAEQTAIWKEAVAIAAEAVLNQESFQEDTANVKAFHYTSGIPNPWNFSRVTASIDELPLDNKRCIRLWASPEVAKMSW